MRPHPPAAAQHQQPALALALPADAGAPDASGTFPPISGAVEGGGGEAPAAGPWEGALQPFATKERLVRTPLAVARVVR